VSDIDEPFDVLVTDKLVRNAKLLVAISRVGPLFFNWREPQSSRSSG